MSFLIDPPSLYANGRAIGAVETDERRAKGLLAATMGVFWGVSVPLYLNQRWTRPVWRACRAQVVGLVVAAVGGDGGEARGAHRFPCR